MTLLIAGNTNKQVQVLSWTAATATVKYITGPKAGRVAQLGWAVLSARPQAQRR